MNVLIGIYLRIGSGQNEHFRVHSSVMFNTMMANPFNVVVKDSALEFMSYRFIRLLICELSKFINFSTI